MRRARKAKRDRVLEEFEKKDLGKDIERSGAYVVIRRQPLLPTSIVLPPELIEKLKAKAAKRGIGYQTMLKIIVHEHVDEY